MPVITAHTILLQIEAKKGGQFEIFGGSVIGKFVELKEGKEVVLDWRFRNWQEGDISKASLIFCSGTQM